MSAKVGARSISCISVKVLILRGHGGRGGGGEKLGEVVKRKSKKSRTRMRLMAANNSQNLCEGLIFRGDL